MADIVKIATELVEACIRQDFAAAYNNADPMLVTGFPEFMLQESWSRVLRVSGNPEKITGTSTFKWMLAPMRGVLVNCKFQRRQVDVQVIFNITDRVIGIQMLAPGHE